MLGRIYQFFAERLAALSLFQKLAVKTILIAVIPLFLVAALFWARANSIILSETSVSRQRAFSQTAVILNNDLQMNKRALSTFASLPQVIDILSAEPGAKGVFDQAMDQREITRSILLVNPTETMYRLRLYVNDRFTFARERISTFPLSEIENATWFADVNRYPYVYLPAREETFIYNDERRVLSIAAGVQAYRTNNEIVGLAMMDIDLDLLKSLITGQTKGGQGAFILLDEDGNVVLETAGAEGNPFAESVIEALLAFQAQYGEVSAAELHGLTLLWTELEIPGWRIVEAVSAQKMAAGASVLLLQMMAILFAVVFLVVLATLLASRSFAGRIARIAETVKDYEGGNRQARMTVNSSDVLGRFEGDMNLLFDRMNLLMDERYSLGRQAKNADMNALQSQINPHFLYNTLDMLYWMARGGEHEQLPEAIITLSSFYRKSLSRGKQIVRLKDELEHIRLYMAIQNKRFPGMIEESFDVDPAIIDAPIIKLSLQPIVENAVNHGIMKSPGRKGRISVSAHPHDGAILIRILDDGPGMSDAQAAALSRAEDVTGGEAGGYGIYNVQRRIRLYYGDAYGLTYESGETGTTVTVRIPLSEE